MSSARVLPVGTRTIAQGGTAHLLSFRMNRRTDKSRRAASRSTGYAGQIWTPIDPNQSESPDTGTSRSSGNAQRPFLTK
ncbi:hypothetical protein SSBG_00515 [Streptomyces sp. SPB074]|nr:hypothetical protein SSBG_00515 [Streptomyces sp. SPB074]